MFHSFTSQFFFVITGTLKVKIISDEDSPDEVIVLPVLSYLKIKSGIKYELENDQNQSSVAFFRLSRRSTAEEVA